MNNVINRTRAVLKTSLASSYVRAVATLSTGQVFAAAIPILAAPVLGRLYLPADYGMLATYMAMANVLGAMSTLQYAQAIIAEKNEQRALALVYICFLVAAGMAVIALAVAVATFTLMDGGGAFAQARGWMLLLPLTTLAAGVTAAIAMLANRHQRYGFMARIQVVAMAITVTISIMLGFLRFGVHGLFIAYFTGQLITVIAHLWFYRSMAPAQPRLGRVKLAAIAHRHRDFAIYTTPSEFVGTISLQLPVFALSFVGAVPLLGAFTRARQLVSMPLTLLGSSIGQVFRQRASVDYREHGTCRPIFKRTFLVLLMIGLPPTIILMVIAPDLFRIFLGPNWVEAGEIARILAPMLLLRLITSPLSVVFYFSGKQRQAFKLMFCGVFLVAIGVLLPIGLGVEPYVTIYGFAISYSVIYIIYFIGSWNYSMKIQ